MKTRQPSLTTKWPGLFCKGHFPGGGEIEKRRRQSEQRLPLSSLSKRCNNKKLIISVGLGDSLMTKPYRAACWAAFTILTAIGLTAAPRQAVAKAGAADYVNCDGYGAATSGGDGMSQLATSLLIFNLPGNGNTGRNDKGLTFGGVSSCTTALEDLPAKHWMRRASLLRARAVHYLQDHKISEALADLDQADAIGKAHNDIFYDRSLGFGTSIIRAYALRQSGDTAKARDAALTALDQRRYLSGSAYMALLAIGPKAVPADIAWLLQTTARYNPLMLDAIYQRALNEGRYADAITLYPQLVPAKDYDQRKSALGQEQSSRAMAEVFWAIRGGECAYALAALGRAAEAKAVLAATRDRLARAVQTPPDAAPDETGEARARRVLIANTNLQINANARMALDEIGGLVDLRLQVQDGHAADVMRALQQKPPSRNWASADLIEAIGKAVPGQTAPAAAAAQKVRADIAANDRSIPPDALIDLSKLLPEAETDQRVPGYRPSNVPILAIASVKNNPVMQQPGYRSVPSVTPGAVAVRFRGLKGTSAIVEEMALLRAAELAHEAGKTGLIVVDRRTVNFTMTITQYGRPLRTDPNGFETELDVVFVNAQAPPAAYAQTAWRVVEVDKVLASLKPLYDRPPAG